jgi:hypothetical protein
LTVLYHFFSSVATTCKSYTDPITGVAHLAFDGLFISVARYEQQKTFRILYPAAGKISACAVCSAKIRAYEESIVWLRNS